MKDQNTCCIQELLWGHEAKSFSPYWPNGLCHVLVAPVDRHDVQGEAGRPNRREGLYASATEIDPRPGRRMDLK